jgi:hypothetical protein
MIPFCKIIIIFAAIALKRNPKDPIPFPGQRDRLQLEGWPGRNQQKAAGVQGKGGARTGLAGRRSILGSRPPEVFKTEKTVRPNQIN